MKWILRMLGLILLVLITSCAGLSEAESDGSEPVSDSGTTVDAPAAKPPVEGSTSSGTSSPPKAAPEPTAETTSAEADDSPSSGVRGAKAEKKGESLTFIDEERADDGSAAASSSTASPKSISRPTQSSSGLKAGFADDNRQYGYFINFLEEHGYVDYIDLPVQERIVFYVKDTNGQSIPNAVVEITGNGSTLVEGTTLADGSYQFNPSEFSSSVQEFGYRVSWQQNSSHGSFTREGIRSVDVEFAKPRFVPDPIPLDVVFVMDTTGSMGEEIARLRATIELIHLNLTNLPVPTSVRFGMVLYKDIGDEYRTKIVQLDESLDSFQAALNLVEASGGGDTPEDLQAALEDTVKRIDWTPDGIRLAFVVTDAPPHLDYEDQYTYADASRQARADGIKIFTVGTGGLDIYGEYVLRQISQYTSGKYIFLTYGEEGQSEGGEPGSVSHHTGANWKADKLESIIIRFAKEELSYLTDEPLPIEDPYFEATKIDLEENEETLSKLFSMAVAQLVDFASIEIPADTAAAVIPIAAIGDELLTNAEYFTERLNFTIAEGGAFTLVERKDIQKIIEEQKLQLTGITDGEGVVELGKILNAEVLITGKLYPKNGYELFLKLLRVETGEVLSITKALIDPELGL